MQIGSIVRSVHIAVPQGARGIVMRILGDMAMVAWYAGEPGVTNCSTPSRSFSKT